mmetsp:Transcript_87119/g.164262  ORF Transcript_87119/g.164262 Transcript_87119/m.164262 type:complete len:204 (+) Transcript_87119:444-1055(+)
MPTCRMTTSSHWATLVRALKFLVSTCYSSRKCLLWRRTWTKVAGMLHLGQGSLCLQIDLCRTRLMVPVRLSEKHRRFCKTSSMLCARGLNLFTLILDLISGSSIQMLRCRWMRPLTTSSAMEMMTSMLAAPVSPTAIVGQACHPLTARVVTETIAVRALVGARSIRLPTLAICQALRHQTKDVAGWTLTHLRESLYIREMSGD